MHPLVDDILHRAADPGSMAALRAALVRHEGPLQRSTADGRVELTFVWIDEPGRAAGGAVSVQCGLVDHGGHSTPMERVGDTAVWALTVEADPDALVSYRFVVDDPFAREGAVDDARWQALMLEAQQRSFADPFNRSRIAPLAALFGLDVPKDRYESILSLPAAPAASWFGAHTAPTGELDRLTLDSAAMGDRRSITVHLPAGASDTDRLPLVVLLDGSSWVSLAGLPRALDVAVARGDLPPAVVAFVHEAEGSRGLADRVVELSCNPAHARMLAEELVPLLQRTYPVDASPQATVLGGASLGGLASTYTAMEHESIGNVLSVSGSYWYGTERDGEPEWLTRRLAAEPARSFRIYQQIGRLEDAPLSLSPGVSHLVANRHFRDVAVAKGHRHVYEEMTTAHDMAAFRVAVMRGLATLLREDGAR